MRSPPDVAMFRTKKPFVDIECTAVQGLRFRFGHGVAPPAIHEGQYVARVKFGDVYSDSGCRRSSGIGTKAIWPLWGATTQSPIYDLHGSPDYRLGSLAQASQFTH